LNYINFHVLSIGTGMTTMMDDHHQDTIRGRSACERCRIHDRVLFADLDAGDFDALGEPIDDLDLRPGDILYRAGQPAAALYTVRTGMIKLEQYLSDGTRRIVGLASQGDVLGLEGTVAASYEHTAIALQPASVCRIPKPIITRMEPKLTRQLMRKWHDAARKAHAGIRDLSTGHARHRVARLFLLLAPPSTHRCRLFGREDVGALLGITTETASRTIADFKRHGLVAEVAGNVFTRNIAALNRIAAGDE
jgi:CRP-like cAMP-binding protein